MTYGEEIEKPTSLNRRAANSLATKTVSYGTARLAWISEAAVCSRSFSRLPALLNGACRTAALQGYQLDSERSCYSVHLLEVA